MTRGDLAPSPDDTDTANHLGGPRISVRAINDTIVSGVLDNSGERVAMEADESGGDHATDVTIYIVHPQQQNASCDCSQLPAGLNDEIAIFKLVIARDSIQLLRDIQKVFTDQPRAKFCGTHRMNLMEKLRLKTDSLSKPTQRTRVHELAFNVDELEQFAPAKAPWFYEAQTAL